MTIMKTAIRSLTLFALVIFGSVALALPAIAGELRGSDWSDDGVVLGQGSNAEVVGFWQGLLWSRGICQFTIDGIFGVATRGHTQAWQAEFGITADGVVGPVTWSKVRYAKDVVFGPRLINYGNGFYTYYGGGPEELGFLYWNGTATGPWIWQMPDTGTWYTTLTNRNWISPYTPC